MAVDPTNALLAWYAVEKRVLPWRAQGGETPDPYRIWLSEIMLQQTTVAAVKPYFAAFTKRWPTVADLAAAEDADVMSAWAGLGYYARARNLLACARVVAEGGGFPDGPGSHIWAMTVFDDGRGPALFVGGEFVAAGGVPASKIARRFTRCAISQLTR